MGLFQNRQGDGKGEGTKALISNLSLFQLSLREGMGFAYACEVSGNCPSNVTKIMQGDDAFYNECVKLVRGANMDRLTAASEYAEKREWDKAEQARQDARKLRKLYLWGDKGKLAEATEDDIFEAFVELNGDVPQLAVCFGAQFDEMKKYIESHPELVNMIRLMQKQWNDGYDSQGRKTGK